MIWALVGTAEPADPAGLPERHDPLPATRDHPVLRLTDDSAGGIVAATGARQSADVWGYPVSYLFSAAGSALSLPFLLGPGDSTAGRHRDGAAAASPEISSAKEIDA